MALMTVGLAELAGKVADGISASAAVHVCDTVLSATSVTSASITRRFDGGADDDDESAAAAAAVVGIVTQCAGDKRDGKTQHTQSSSIRDGGSMFFAVDMRALVMPYIPHIMSDAHSALIIQ